MKIKRSLLEQIIKEEVAIFRENHGHFPPSMEDECSSSSPMAPMEGEMDEMMKSDLRLMYSKLLEHLGAERLTSEILKHLNPRALRDVLETLAKLYGLRIQ